MVDYPNAFLYRRRLIIHYPTRKSKTCNTERDRGWEQIPSLMDKQTTDMRAFDVLTEKPEEFTIETLDGSSITLHLYPLQLSRLAMITKRLLALDAVFGGNDPEDSVKWMWKVCAEKPREVAEIIAIASLRTKSEADSYLRERTELIYDSPSMTPNAYAALLSTIVFQSYCQDFMNAIRLVKTLRVMISPTTTAERIAGMADEVSGGKSMPSQVDTIGRSTT